jgi:hypothetical protein
MQVQCRYPLAQIQLLTRVYRFDVRPCDTSGLLGRWEYKMRSFLSFLFPFPFLSFPTPDPQFFFLSDCLPASHLISCNDEDFSPSRNRFGDGGLREPERCGAETVELDRGTDRADEQRACQWTSRDQCLAGVGILGHPVWAGAGWGFEVRCAGEVCWVECSQWVVFCMFALSPL